MKKSTKIGIFLSGLLCLFLIGLLIGIFYDDFLFDNLGEYKSHIFFIVIAAISLFFASVFIGLIQKRIVNPNVKTNTNRSKLSKPQTATAGASSVSRPSTPDSYSRNKISVGTSGTTGNDNTPERVVIERYFEEVREEKVSKKQATKSAPINQPQATPVKETTNDTANSKATINPTPEDNTKNVKVSPEEPKKEPVIMGMPNEQNDTMANSSKKQTANFDANLVGLLKKDKVNYTFFDGCTVKISDGWKSHFESEGKKHYFNILKNFIKEEYEKVKVFPNKEDIFKTFELTDFDNVRVVIVGKFPYYRQGQNDGLAFSTKAGVNPNPTTKVIIKECIDDVGIPMPTTGSLVSWAEEGVLLLNTVLTSPADKPASHSESGWKKFTANMLVDLNDDIRPKVFVLWGEQAQEVEEFVTNKRHLILKAPNPSPLSAANGFYGSKPFSKINAFLISNGIRPIDWNIK